MKRTERKRLLGWMQIFVWYEETEAGGARRIYMTFLLIGFFRERKYLYEGLWYAWSIPRLMTTYQKKHLFWFLIVCVLESSFILNIFKSVLSYYIKRHKKSQLLPFYYFLCCFILFYQAISFLSIFHRQYYMCSYATLLCKTENT